MPIATNHARATITFFFFQTSEWELSISTGSIVSHQRGRINEAAAGVLKRTHNIIRAAFNICRTSSL